MLEAFDQILLDRGQLNETLLGEQVQFNERHQHYSCVVKHLLLSLVDVSQCKIEDVVFRLALQIVSFEHLFEFFNR